MPGNNLTDIEKEFINQQVTEWKRIVYGQRAIGIDVDTLNTKLAIKHDNGEVWEILIKCKRIAEPVKSGPAGLTTWEKTDEVIPKGLEVISLDGQMPDPSQLPPTSPYSPEKIAEDMELLPTGQLHIGELAARALANHHYQLRGPAMRSGEILPSSLGLVIGTIETPIPQRAFMREDIHRLDTMVKPGSTHESWLKKGLEKCPVTDDDIMNLQAGLEAAAPFFSLMDEEGRDKHIHTHPHHLTPWWHDAGYGEM